MSALGLTGTALMVWMVAAAPQSWLCWAVLVIQIAILALLVRHDLYARRAVHSIERNHLAQSEVGSEAISKLRELTTSMERR